MIHDSSKLNRQNEFIHPFRGNLAFTLIELLVVIAIIGILSGIIMVSMSGATNSARTAKAQVFANSLRNAIYNNLLNEWKLDGNTNDSWSGNNGTLSGTAHWLTSDCVYSGCFDLDGSSNYFTLTSTITFAGSFTVSFWAYRDTNSSYDFVFGGVDSTNKIGFHNGANNLFIRVANTSDYANSDLAPLNQWNLIVVTRNASNVVNSYVNAQSAKTSFTQSGNFSFNIIGKDESSNYMDGKLDEIRFFNETVPVSQIQELYFAGLKRLLASHQITQAEYDLRLAELYHYCAFK